MEKKKMQYKILSKLRTLQIILLTIIVALTLIPTHKGTNLIMAITIFLLFISLVINFKIKKKIRGCNE